jgi:O-antigen ligase
MGMNESPPHIRLPKSVSFGEPNKAGIERSLPKGDSLLDLKPLEWTLCCIVLVSCVALHFQVVYNRLGLPLEAGLSLLSFATPISGMLYLSASQVLPDPPMGPFTCSQLAVLGFLVWQVRGGSKGWTRGASLFVESVAPFFLWILAVDFLNGRSLHIIALLSYAVLTGWAGAVLTWQSQKRIMNCLLAFLAGQLLAATVFWIVKLGLGVPVQAFNIEAYGDSTAEGAIRFGTARGNAGILGTTMAIVTMGAMALWIGNKSDKYHSSRLLSAISGVWFALAVAALFGAGSRGPMLALSAGIALFIFAGLTMRELSLSAIITVVLAGAVLTLAWHWLRLEENWTAMMERQTEQVADRGVFVAGRVLEWTAGWGGILNSPIFGGGHVELLSFEGAEEYWVSHSTYLDVGLEGGIPAMVLFVWFTMKPLVMLWDRRREFAVGVLLAIYTVVILCNGQGSCIQSKHFWILWGLAAVCFSTAFPGSQRERLKQSRTVRRDSG